MKQLPPLINEHVYRDGRRSRWYRDLTAAKEVLDGTERPMRGNFTLLETLRTSPGIWRVDDLTKSQ